MLRGLKRASLSAGGDMGPNRLRQTRAKAQCGTFSSRSRAGERAVTFPIHMVSLLIGPRRSPVSRTWRHFDFPCSTSVGGFCD